MRAILNNDIIVTLVSDVNKGVEIGSLPKDVGMERLRFNGVEVVDLATLSAFWVEPISGGFMLHAIKVPSSYYVEMAFSDREYLHINGGTPTVKTAEKIAIEKQANQIRLLKNKLRLRLFDLLGDTQDQNMNTLAFVCALIVYARMQPAALGEFFDEIIPDIIEIFPLNMWRDILKSSAKDLKTAMQEYYEGMENL